MRSSLSFATATLAFCAPLLLPSTATAQGTLADYERATTLQERFDGLALDIAATPTWVEQTHRFWYRKSVRDGNMFVLVDADTLEQGPAFDHTRVAAALSTATGNDYGPATLPFRTLEFVDEAQEIEIPVDGTFWRCALESTECHSTGREVPRFRSFGRRPDRGEPLPSPDGQWEALIDNHNVAVRAIGSDNLIRLSLDGSEGSAYELASIAWSPDSAKLAAYRVRPGYRREVHYVESSPEDQVQPKHSSRVYPKPGDVLAVEQPVLFEIANRQQIVIDDALFPNPYSMSPLQWRADSRAFTLEYNQRGHQVYRIIEVDGQTGSARAVISEEAETFFNYRTIRGRQTDSGKKFRHDLDDGAEVIWMSERDGWNHLYLFDGATGETKNQITQGEWVVRSVEKVDEEARQIWFSASGMDPRQDPYFVHYYRVGFDGRGLTALTHGDVNHAAAFSDDMTMFIDTYSRVDMAPVTELRRAKDGALVNEIVRGDISTLQSAGWKPPEVFAAKGRDGVTDIWGVIFRPLNFDPSRTYPVIENIYAGPQGSFVPKSFRAFSSMQVLAELGFIVVQIDGMGTSNRSKAFHDIAWKNLGDAGLPDRILWHEAAAAAYPSYDISRVGIYGTSAGGQSSLGALLFHPDFYDVAVSASGCHDNRMDKIWWNEQWMGWPIGPQYSASSNVDNAHKLVGNVLLIVGELDTNVDPASTLQVMDALIRADKPFDSLFIPGAGHTSGGDYGQHKRMDYFVQHLLDVTPPSWPALAETLARAQ